MEINQILTGSCLDILPQLADGSFDLAFADPPYWVDFDYARATKGGKRRKGQGSDKSMAYIDPVWLVEQLQRIAKVVLITPGMKCFYDYPKAPWQVAWFKPGSHSLNGLGGFGTWEPILVYGKPSKPVWIDSIRLPMAANFSRDAEFHACPKPEALLRWLIDNFSEPGDKVLDPVSGSGTTCKAAYQLGRQYLGIEVDETVAELSRQRIIDCQPPLFMVESMQQLKLEV